MILYNVAIHHRTMCVQFWDSAMGKELINIRVMAWQPKVTSSFCHVFKANPARVVLVYRSKSLLSTTASWPVATYPSVKLDPLPNHNGLLAWVGLPHNFHVFLYFHHYLIILSWLYWLGISHLKSLSMLATLYLMISVHAYVHTCVH